MHTRGKRWLVYSSVGDRAAIERWATGPRDYDVFVTYYGDRPGRYAGLADQYQERKGTKFACLLDWWRASPELFAPYDAVLVIDDDLALTPGQVTALFESRERHELALLQPAFSARGKVSWSVTRQRPRCELHFTDFVENGAPLFAADELWAFLESFDGSLTGWGIDYWYLHSIDARARPGRVAVIDTVVVRNPRDHEKAGGRQIDQARTRDERMADWDSARERYGIPTYEPEVVGQVLLPVGGQVRAVITALPDTLAWWGKVEFGAGRRRALRGRAARCGHRLVRHLLARPRAAAPDQGFELAVGAESGAGGGDADP